MKKNFSTSEQTSVLESEFQFCLEHKKNNPLAIISKPVVKLYINLFIK